MKYLAGELQVGTRYWLDLYKTDSGEFNGLDEDGAPTFKNMSDGSVYIKNIDGLVAIATDGNDYYYPVI